MSHVHFFCSLQARLRDLAEASRIAARIEIQEAEFQNQALNPFFTATMGDSVLETGDIETLRGCRDMDSNPGICRRPGTCSRAGSRGGADRR